jgi:hypothetical protein
MGTSSPSPDRAAPAPLEIPIGMSAPADRSPEDVWRRLTAGCNESWLAEIGTLRVEDDDLERSLDIWSIMLIAALRDPKRRDTAAAVLARLRRMTDTLDDA